MRHELHLARAGFVALAGVAAIGAVIGALISGTDGAVSALIGVAVVAGNHAIAVASTSWARALTPGVLAIGYSVFVVRLLFVLGIFGTLSTLTWTNDALLASFFCVALVLSLGAECLSYVRGTYVPAWRSR